ncbi:hypothetical protein CONPUDRAFT_75387 [Coniophora puteana RWD-64-598 SS2]|uniref:Uncharacterized protein n=1 Tax=Coniophora puteana (strain RWD-64-598) TaxID=741705 RepID=A0A5M3MFG5_CONPW|nr:uncharacterized protein CONPUDRAFT_75387 [Coniophora puteana RWD-64-598 SS2]EIW77524.1 hypothetical protein CONPUDRAFT_75387 [Coniophora puteana RWD-64-598 SS2]
MPVVSNSPTWLTPLVYYQIDSYLFALCLGDEYVLEVEFIWKRKVSWLTLAYTFLRYAGVIATVTLHIHLSDKRLVDRYNLPLLTLGVSRSQFVFLAFLANGLTCAGVMTARVCALFDNSKKIAIPLATFYALVQLLNIALAIINFIPPYGWTETEGIFFGIHTCIGFVPKSPLGWSLPAMTGAYITYELVLLVMAIYRSVEYLKSYSHTGSWLSGVVSILLRHNILYFLLLVVYQILTPIANDDTHLVGGLNGNLRPALTLMETIGEEVAIGNLGLALQTLLPCIGGPWIILELRKNHVMHLNGGYGMTQESMTSIAFERDAVWASNNEVGGSQVYVDLQVFDNPA